MRRLCRTITTLAFLLVSAVSAHAVLGDDAALSAEELIARLGDASFQVREDAAEELARRGLEIKDALEAARKHPDFEVRLRVQKLIEVVGRSDLERRLAAFVEDVEGKAEHNLPGWNSYQERVGNDKSARALFADMVRGEKGLLELYDRSPKETSVILAQRIMSWQTRLQQGLGAEVSPASLAALLFVGGDPQIEMHYTIGYQMYAFLTRSSNSGDILGGRHSASMQKLLSGWLVRGVSDNSLSRYNMMLSMQYDMKETSLEMAKLLLKNKNAAYGGLPYGMLAIAKYGDKADAELLKPLLTETNTCHTWYTGQAIIKTQVRDVALLGLLHMNGKDPKDYGWERLSENTQTVYSIHTCGFEDDEKREAAFAKWQKEQAESEKE